jgi:hypothetical protein
VNINSPTILNLLTILTGWCFTMFMFHQGTITNTSCSRTCCITKDKIGMLVKMKSISQLKAQKKFAGDSHYFWFTHRFIELDANSNSPTDLKLESPLEPPHHPHCIHDTTPPEDQSYPHTPLTLILINPSPSH